MFIECASQNTIWELNISQERNELTNTLSNLLYVLNCVKCDHDLFVFVRNKCNLVSSSQQTSILFMGGYVHEKTRYVPSIVHIEGEI